ncbi:hypothetical protein IQ06DRAFT_302152 [Phaeosphaeriaceae sp. SRC1lsM3a]|nr:hypothetical protein IQ06DRAFT_302152 [Stagonospora sp. SRC1lsM3a]
MVVTPFTKPSREWPLQVRATKLVPPDVYPLVPDYSPHILTLLLYTSVNPFDRVQLLCKHTTHDLDHKTLSNFVTPNAISIYTSITNTSKMVGIKRTRGDLITAEAASMSSVPSPTSQQHATAASGDGDKPSKKKHKQGDLSVPNVQKEAIQGSVASANASVPREAGKSKKKASIPRVSIEETTDPRLAVERVPDQEMSDVPSSEEDNEEGSSKFALTQKQIAPQSSGKATKNTLHTAEEEMSDAPPNEEDSRVELSPKTITATRGAILPFSTPPTVLAHQVATHQYAPTPLAAQQAYLQEVHKLHLFPPRHPMQTTDSTVSEQVRHAIYERYFLGKTNEECIPIWNSYGGKVTSAAAVSKVLLRDTRTWFAEENAVLPWMARKNDEKSKLKELGMGPRNFPSPHTVTAISANGIRARNGAAPRNQPATNDASRSNAGQPSKQNASRPANPVRPSGSFVGADGDDDGEPSNSSSADSGSKYSASKKSSSAGSQNNADSAPSPEDYQVKLAEDDVKGPPIRALIMAATNAFAFGKDSFIPLAVDSRRYMVPRQYLTKHCGWVRNRPKDQLSLGFSCNGHDPIIVRAFIQAITPGRLDPKNRLPEYDIDFKFSHKRDLEGWDDSDPVGVIDGDGWEAHRIIWDVAACILMYELAMAMECKLVQNLVVDQLQVLYREEEETLRDNDRRVLEQPQLPLDLLPNLSLEDDRNLICIIGAIHINRMTWNFQHGEQFDWPEELSAEVIDMIEQWADHNVAPVSTPMQEWYCRRFHRHAEGEECHMLTEDKDFPTTHEMISDLYSGLRDEAELQCTKVLRDFDQKDSDEIFLA